MALAGADMLIYPTAIGWNPDDDAAEKKRQLVTRSIEHNVPEEKKVCPKCGGREFTTLGDGAGGDQIRLLAAAIASRADTLRGPDGTATPNGTGGHNLQAGSQFDPIMVEALIEAIEAHGWDVTDTLPEILPAPLANSEPTLGSDDDDPTVRPRLALHVPAESTGPGRTGDGGDPA